MGLSGPIIFEDVSNMGPALALPGLSSFMLSAGQNLMGYERLDREGEGEALCKCCAEPCKPPRTGGCKQILPRFHCRGRRERCTLTTSISFP